VTTRTNLNQVTRSFYVAEIEETPLLFHKHSGEVSSINRSAALLINLAQSGFSDREIISEVSQALTVSEEQIHQDLENLYLDLIAIKQTDDEEEIEPEQLPLGKFKINSNEASAAKVCFYKIANIVFKIGYPDLESYQICHSLLCELTISSANQHDIEFKLTQGLNGWAIYINGQIQFAMENRSSFADYIRTAIIDTIGKKFTNWIGLHAAGILNQCGQVLLFAAPSGSGKSTLAVELMLGGLGYLGDDTQILDLDQQEIWPFPTSANLKPGSWPLFEQRLKKLNKTPIFRAESRPVKFLPIKMNLDTANKAYKTKAIIFPEYIEESSGEIRKIDLFQRIQLLSDSGCYSKVEASSEMSQKYMEYILSMDAYQLKYSSSQQAIQFLKSTKLLD